MNSYRLLLLTFVAWLLALSISSAEPHPDAGGVVIVVNTSFPKSVEIGEYYAEQRGIPKQNIIRLKMGTQETITPRQYVDTIFNPLLSELIDEKFVQGVRSNEPDRFGRVCMSVAVNSISYLVTIHGVPLRISNDPTLVEANLGNLPKQFQVNQSSVDSELALLLAPSGASMTALIQNPLFEKKSYPSSALSRFIRVTRLDGHTASDVTRLIDRTLEAEEQGLMGRAYFDIGGPHASGDEWIQQASEIAESIYFDSDRETSKDVMDWHSRYDAPAIYMGWYRQNAYGPWLSPRWPVPAGAIGFHLHSFSATTLRTSGKGWLGDFVRQGYCVTMGNVHEPYLEFTHRPQHLLEHLVAGHTFGESIFYSTKALGWMGVAIGDPLYRPFKVDLDEQLSREPDGPFSAYVYSREINRLQSEESVDAAITYARARFAETPSLPLAYKLSQLYAGADQTKEAIEVLRILRYINQFGDDEQVLVKQIADHLNTLGESKAALDVYEKLLGQKNLSKVLRIALLDDGAVVATSARNPRLSSRWSIEAQQLKAPPQPK